jgi:hypothetical protein
MSVRLAAIFVAVASRAWVFTCCSPFPVPDLRHILAVSVYVVLVLNEFVLHLLLQVVAFGAQIRCALMSADLS